MPGTKRARVCQGLGGGCGGRGEFGPQPLQDSCKKGARPEAEESNPVLPPLLCLSAPRLQERPQEPICVLYDMSEGSGTPKRCDNSTEPSKLPGLLVRGASALGGTDPSPGLSPAICGVKAKSFPLSGPRCPRLMDEEEA